MEFLIGFVQVVKMWFMIEIDLSSFMAFSYSEIRKKSNRMLRISDIEIA